MIIKHVPMKSAKKSDFSKLIDYLANEKKATERVGHVAISNCHSDSIKASVGEILATQHSNTRASSDKTYHLIVSFPPNEIPNQNALTDIEKRVCSILGFEEHQRISIAHHDTDHFHLHIAINKIHPEKLTLHDPFKAYKKLGLLCEELEVEYGLQQVNHTAKRTKSQNSVDDMEAHTSTQSFTSWVREECLDSLTETKNWTEFSAVLQERGVEIRQKGNGFIFTTGDQVHVKASTVDRSLSKSKLEAKFGQFKPIEHQPVSTSSYKKYTQKPLGFQIDTSSLYQEYLNDQQQILDKRNELLGSLSSSQKFDIRNIKNASVLKRKSIKLLGHSRLNKRLLYAIVHAQKKQDFKKVRREYQQLRRSVYQSHKRVVWSDWLKIQALNGRSDALKALRSKEKKTRFRGNTVEGSQVSQGVFNLDAPTHVTKTGTEHYRSSDNQLIRNNGDQLQIPMNASNQGILELLQIAQLKFGSQLNLTGTPEFKAKAVFLAARHQLSISFTDVALEQRKQKLIEDAKNGQQRDREERSRAHRRGSSTLRQRGTESQPKAGTREPQSSEAAGNSTSTRNVYPGLLGFINAALQQSNAKQARREPPPFAKNNLRNLSELDVVRFSRRSEVLLQDDVSGQLEYKGTQSNSELRRGNTDDQFKYINHQKAVEKYIKERSEKRQQGIDIPIHIQYSGEKGEFIFTGLRKIDGFDMVLLKKEEGALVVKPISTKQAQQLKRSKIGAKLRINDHGRLIKVGRTR